MRIRLLNFAVILGGIASCTGQNRILHEDTERGIVLRFTNVETIGCWGEPGVGGTAGSVSLELRDGGTHSIILPKGCGDSLSFDGDDPLRLVCDAASYPVHPLPNGRTYVGAAGDERSLNQIADEIVSAQGPPVLKPLLTKAYERGQMAEFLITLGDTDCGEYWKLSFDALSETDQKRVLDGLRQRPGSSELRKKRLDTKR